MLSDGVDTGVYGIWQRCMEGEGFRNYELWLWGTLLSANLAAWLMRGHMVSKGKGGVGGYTIATIL